MRHCACSTISLSAHSCQLVTAYGTNLDAADNTTRTRHSILEALAAHMLVYGSDCKLCTVHLINNCKTYLVT